jgi:hypothetical protein
MEISLLSTSDNFDTLPYSPESYLSFTPFARHLKTRLPDEHHLKASFYASVIARLEHETSQDALIHIRDSSQYRDLFEIVSSILAPAALPGEDVYWALSSPVPDAIFYSTHAFSVFAGHKKSLRATMESACSENYEQQKNNFLYTLIGERFYGITSRAKKEFVYSVPADASDLSRSYSISIDTQFIDIALKSVLPPLTNEILDFFLSEEKDPAKLQQALPLGLFVVEGFSIITLQDVTIPHALDQVRNILVNHTYTEKEYSDVIHALRNMIGNPSIRIGLLPFLKVNDRSVLIGTDDSISLIMNSAMRAGLSEQKFNALLNEYIRHPRTIINNGSTPEDEHDPFSHLLRRKEVVSYALLPVYFRQQLVGVIELYSSAEDQFDRKLLVGLEPAIGLVAQLMKSTAEEFSNKVEATIREKFTSLQPSVQWKFNEVAWNYLRKDDAATLPDTDPIVFHGVYPFYGAVDVRNSTMERGRAVQQDVQAQLSLLQDTFNSVKEAVDTLVFECDRWGYIMEEYRDTKDDKMIHSFLKTEVHPFLKSLEEKYPETKTIIDYYWQALGADETISKNRSEFEGSLNLINTTLNRYFERAHQEIQAAYPSYFAKFRTDGIEYDIYTGQAIAPEHTFTIAHIKTLRQWQLKSMAEVSRLTGAMLPHMARPLQTTQLIFVHSNPIDIGFRMDERRFDVEGAYNIRYEVIKKRIDKILIKGTKERLTQPGKIALVYFSQTEAKEYSGYIEALQKEGVLDNKIEFLELDELQGISGLKGLRVSVL